MTRWCDGQPRCDARSMETAPRGVARGFTAWELNGTRTGRALLVCGRLGEVIATLGAGDEPGAFLTALGVSLARVSDR